MFDFTSNAVLITVSVCLLVLFMSLSSWGIYTQIKLNRAIVKIKEEQGKNEKMVVDIASLKSDQSRIQFKETKKIADAKIKENLEKEKEILSRIEKLKQEEQALSEKIQRMTKDELLRRLNDFK